MNKPANIPKYRFLESLRKTVGNSKFNLMNNHFYTLETGDRLVIQSSNDSSIICNFLSYTNTGEMAVNFQGKGLAIISPKTISNIMCIF